jgi:hypothetical protein
MTTNANLSRHVAAGDVIKPWLLLGPFYEDMSATVQGLTCFEKPGATVGRAALTEVMDQAQAILAAQPHEGEESAFRGQRKTWNLVRLPEKYLSWGRYNISNHLGAAFLTTIISASTPGQRRWRLITGITSRAVVAINGAVVYDTDAHPTAQVNSLFAYTFTADLPAGENVVTVALFRLGRMAQVGCQIDIDSDADVRVALGDALPAAGRAHVEDELTNIRLLRDVFYPEQAVGFNLGVAPGAGMKLVAALQTESGQTLFEVAPTAAGPVTLCQGKDLREGHYQVVCTWTGAQGKPVTSTSFAVHKVTPEPVLPGYERMAERKKIALERAAANHEAWGNAIIWPEVARYALGRYDQVTERGIREMCDFIAARKDCSDFGIQGLLRLMYWERDKQRLSPQINALMKDTVLGFKYWVDEPGDTVMYMGSENHRFLFHVAEWMAGQLFPTEEFTNSRMRGLYHATKGRMYITEWLRQRGRFGFDEWHSNSYFPVNIAPLINIYDFAIYEDAKLRQMAGAVLDYVFFILAADTYQGIFGTTHGRSYGINLKYPDYEGTSSTCWLLYGTAGLIGFTAGMSPVSIASSTYTLPPLLAGIATDNKAVVDAKMRQGVSSGSAPHANFCVYRTPDYMMSAVQDHRKGEYESSTHVAQVTMGNKTCIFWSCPHTSGEGSGLRPDYWSGHTTLPRVIQERNVMALTWRLTGRAWMSHCFFEPEHFDEVLFDGNWVFGRIGAGYVGIYSQNGLTVGDQGQYAGRELVCTAQENTWLVECGREADWSSFEAFVHALSTASIKVRDGAVTYASPSIGRFVTGWDVAPTVNGTPLKLRGYPLVDSAWAYSAFGSGEMVMRYNGIDHEVWYNQ